MTVIVNAEAEEVLDVLHTCLDVGITTLGKSAMPPQAGRQPPTESP